MKNRKSSALPGDFFFQCSRVCWVKLHTETHGEGRLGCRESEESVRPRREDLPLASAEDNWILPEQYGLPSELSQENPLMFQANFCQKCGKLSTLTPILIIYPIFPRSLHRGRLLTSQLLYHRLCKLQPMLKKRTQNKKTLMRSGVKYNMFYPI